MILANHQAQPGSSAKPYGRKTASETQRSLYFVPFTTSVNVTSANSRLRAAFTIGATSMPDVDIGKNCRINKAIIDAGAKIEPGTVIGEDPDADRERGFRVGDGGITLVTPDMLGQELHFTR